MRAETVRRIVEQMVASGRDAPDLHAAIERWAQIGRDAAAS